MTNGMVIGRLRVTPDAIAFSPRDQRDCECFSFEVGRSDLTSVGIDGEGRRAALGLEFPNGTAMRIQTVNAPALRQVVEGTAT